MVIAYVLTYASLMLVFGKLGDLLGYRRIFRSGLLVSAVGFVALLGWRRPTGCCSSAACCRASASP